MRKSYLFVLALLLCIATSAAAFQKPLIIKVDELKPGMEGYGLSVFKGIKIERFKVKVIGVLKNVMPKQDIILMRCSGAGLEHSRVVAGMSGSPIYFKDPVTGKDRLAGALAYAWPFSRDPIAGVTPIESMLNELKRPLRRRDIVAFRKLPKNHFLKPAQTPVFMSGFTAQAVKLMKPILTEYNMVPLVGVGGVGGVSGGLADAAGKAKLEPGSAIGVELLRGDLNMVGTGTVTHRIGNTVLAFGHPMFGIGEQYFPITTSYIHHIFAGVSMSFKFSSPLNRVGTLTQDRRSCIIGQVGPKAPTVPITIAINNPQANRNDVYRMEAIQHKRFTPILALISLFNTMMTAASDREEVTFTVDANIGIKGYPNLKLREHFFSRSGLLSYGLISSHLFRSLQAITNNRFKDAELTSISYKINMKYARNHASIEAIRFEHNELEAGKKATFIITLRKYKGERFEVPVTFMVPKELAGRRLRLNVAAGRYAYPDLPPVDKFEHMLANIKKKFHSKSIVTTIPLSTQGFKYRGQHLKSLPRTALDVLQTTLNGFVSSDKKQIVTPVPFVAQGYRSVYIKVKKRKD